jgi:hypothetical protein
MKRIKKVSSILIITLLVLSSIALVVAQNEEPIETGESTLLSRFKYLISKIGLFTAQGQARSCDINPRYTWHPGDVSDNWLRQADMYSKCPNSMPSALINVFDSDYKFIDEYRLEYAGAGLIVTNRIVEIYCCPYKPCKSVEDNLHSDCKSSPSSNYGDYCNTVYGSCYGTAPTHQTQIYQCINNQWQSVGTASFGQENWCLDPNHKNWRLGTSAGGCYSKAPDGWCGGETEPDCNPLGASCGGPSNLQSGNPCCSPYVCSNFQCVEMGTECTPDKTEECSIENGLGTRTCVPNGIWGECLVTSCNEGYINQNNKCVDGSLIGETGKEEAMTWIEFYSISDDEFYDKKSYCVNDVQCSPKEGYEVKCLERDLESGPFYKREYSIFRDKCKEGIGILGPILNTFKRLIPGFSSLPNLCDGLSEGVIALKRAFLVPGAIWGKDDGYVGYCVAESKTSYGRIWDGWMKIVGGFGIPYQYVFMTSILLIILALSLIIPMIRPK